MTRKGDVEAELDLQRYLHDNPHREGHAMLNEYRRVSGRHGREMQPPPASHFLDAAGELDLIGDL
jgi:hypothetical protein